jgi:hypothetical protein
MKKTTLFLALAVGSTAVFAQDLTSKKGEPYLPETGDWAISFDANPFLKYAGNLFGSSTANTGPTANFVNAYTMMITGKKFIDEKTAYRASVRLGFNSTKNVADIDDATVLTVTYPNIRTRKQDDVKMRNHFVGVGAGIEKRRGKTRLQGYYGADAWIWTSGQSVKYDYGNTLTATGTAPVGVSQAQPGGINGTTTGFGTNTVLGTFNPGLTNITTDYQGNAARITSASIGQTFGIGVRGFIGAEYFLFPKISIGAEYGWGFGFFTTGSSTYSTESVGGTPAIVGTQTTVIKKTSGVSLDNDINGGGSGSGTGSLKLTLHF